MKKLYDVAIIGAGASGLMAAASLPKHLNILIIDANPKIGAKILASGGGKCNVTNENVSTYNYLGDEYFTSFALENFTCKDTLAFFEEFGVHPKVRSRGQYFCQSSAKEITSSFAKVTKHCDIRLNTKCLNVKKNEGIFNLTCKDEKFTCKRLVVASGGLSYPQLNTSDIGYEIAKTFSHSIKTTAPALVGLTVQKDEFWMKELSGISFPACFTCKERHLEGELLFSHRGISGPSVLDLSLFWEKGKVELDFLPHESVVKLLETDVKKQITSLLPLPKRFVKAFLERIGIEDKPSYQLKKDEKEKLKTIHSYIFSPAGTFGYKKAEVTKGGVSTDEVNPVTFESLKEPNLYFLGEVLDVTGMLGGYNFQWAFSSAVSFARNLT